MRNETPKPFPANTDMISLKFTHHLIRASQFSISRKAIEDRCCASSANTTCITANNQNSGMDGDASLIIKGVVTSPTNDQYLAEIQPSVSSEDDNHNDSPVLKIDPSQIFQTIDGFGYTLTGGSAIHLMEMSESNRASILEEIFGSTLQISVLRISIGASDLDTDPYSLAEVADDFDLAHFSMERELEYQIPILQQIRTINPTVQLLATPWSAPSWMKDNTSTVAGSLSPNMYDVYANYLVKYLVAMTELGLEIHSMTIQNEPLNPNNNPSMYMASADQGIFIKDHLAPALQAEGLSTKILLYDHNLDEPDYVIDLLNDESIKNVVEGSAFHLYAGSIDTMSMVHESHPDRSVHLTEQWVAADGSFEGDLLWHMEHVWIGGLRNWAETILEWNFSSNPSLEPHTEGGCDKCLGAITIDGEDVSSRNVAYYLAAHVAPYVPRGSVRIQSNWSASTDNLLQVVLQRPDGKLVALLGNTSGDDTVILVQEEQGEQQHQVTLPQRSVATLLLNNPPS